MVITEIAATLVLLVGAGLMIKSFANLERVQDWFQTRQPADAAAFIASL